MRVRHWGAESFLPWVEGVAGHIGDPVARLRFLRVAAPCAQPPSVSKLHRRIPMLVLDLTVVALLILAFTAVFLTFVKR